MKRLSKRIAVALACAFVACLFGVPGCEATKVNAQDARPYAEPTFEQMIGSAKIAWENRADLANKQRTMFSCVGTMALYAGQQILSDRPIIAKSPDRALTADDRQTLERALQMLEEEKRIVRGPNDPYGSWLSVWIDKLIAWLKELLSK